VAGRGNDRRVTKLIATVATLAGLAAAQSLPQNLVGVCASYLTASSPRLGGCVTAAFLVNQGQKIYSYSTYDISLHHGAPPTAALRTGAATVLKQFGSITILGMAGAGPATSPTATTLSIGGSVGAAVPLGKSHCFLMGEFQGVNTSGKAARLVLLIPLK